jgi:hypothetical protein
MCSFFILEFNVVRFSPSLAAAPSGPPIWPLVSPKDKPAGSRGRRPGDDGQDDAAIALAGKSEGERARAQILLETVPQLESKKAERLRLAIGSLPVSALEPQEVLSNASPRAARAVAEIDTDRLCNVVRSAASAGRFSTACKLAAMLTGRPQSYAARIVLTQVNSIPTLKDRLQAITEIAAYLPDPLLDQACEIAAGFSASARFSIAEYSRSDIIEFRAKTTAGHSSRRR